VASEKPRKISIGFQGGQILSARVPPEELTKLRDALAAGGWHELKAEDGDAMVDLGQVVYLLTDSDEHRVGF
jgi:hypothetical protein